jgi:hypothetical protein
LIKRVILAIDILFWYVKSLSAYWFVKSVGPMLILIEKMIFQLIFYSLILVLFVFAFGVSTQSLMYPNQLLNTELLKRVFFPGFFVISKEYYTRTDIMDGKKNKNYS